MQTKINTKSVSIIGILVAMEIILARFSVHTWNLKIGFSFVPIAVAAIFYGPACGGDRRYYKRIFVSGWRILFWVYVFSVFDRGSVWLMFSEKNQFWDCAFGCPDWTGAYQPVPEYVLDFIFIWKPVLAAFFYKDLSNCGNVSCAVCMSVCD